MELPNKRRLFMDIKKKFDDFMASEPKGIVKLIILCVLVVMTFMFFFTGLSRLFGFAYHTLGVNVSELVYYAYGGMKAVDIIYGILCLGIAALSCYTAISLFNCKPNVPKLLALTFGSAVCVDTLFMILSIIILSADGTSIVYYIFRILIFFALFMLCRIVFEKRVLSNVFKK